MRCYIDSGIFIDYLIGRGPAATHLRFTSRRGRSIGQLATDAETCFRKIGSRQNEGITSSLTFYEVEEALYQQLANSASGIAHGKKYVLPAARSVMTQMLITVNLYNINVIELTRSIIQKQLGQVDLQVRGIRAGDSLHMTTAIESDTDIILSGDTDILELNNAFNNLRGIGIKCWDTDVACGAL